MRRINWVVKVSKLCNLRCRYCYEWNDLAKRDRISLGEWAKLLVAVRSYHELMGQRGPVQTHIIWHGGEPLLLPVAYIDSVMRLEREVLGDDLARGSYVNSLQTNLYSLKKDQLDLLQGEGFYLGISLDLVGGVRLTMGGKETEERVVRNIDLLTAHGIDFGAIVVLASHTRPYLRQIYHFYEELGVALSILPLFDAPLNQPGAYFAVTNDELVEALKDLFVYWVERPHRINVSPLTEYLETVLLRLLGETRSVCDRRRKGEYTILVNTDGALYERIDAYDPDKAVGNVFGQTIEEILRSPDYAASLDRDEALAGRYCDTCEYLGPCDRSPVFESPRNDLGHSRCHLAYPLYRFIEEYVRERGITTKQIRRILDN